MAKLKSLSHRHVRPFDPWHHMFVKGTRSGKPALRLPRLVRFGAHVKGPRWARVLTRPAACRPDEAEYIATCADVQHVTMLRIGNLGISVAGD